MKRYEQLADDCTTCHEGSAEAAELS
jgi:hypothetical protein